ncbi:MAG: hypothetical protein LBI15_11370 [Dysgonamonadaceae bacterium]|jgi:hypothetical protein|nr:hypothetical protein [Dysgonamonadaceae bacterium]
MNKIFTIGIIGLFLLLCGCDKKETYIAELIGTYSGTISYMLNNERQNRELTLTLSKNGSYIVAYSEWPNVETKQKYFIEGNEIIFHPNDPMLRTTFAPGFLMGRYNFSLSGKKLKLDSDLQTINLVKN